MEEATTKPSEDEIKFGEVHAYLSKGEYPPFVSKSLEKNSKYKWYCGNCKV